MKEGKRNQMPRGIGYAIGPAIGITMFVVFGLFLKNIAIGIAAFTSGYAIGFAIEGQGDVFTSEQKKYAFLSTVSGIIILAVCAFLFFQAFSR